MRLTAIAIDSEAGPVPAQCRDVKIWVVERSFGGHEARRRASGAAGRVGTSRRDERPCRVRQVGRNRDAMDRDFCNDQENRTLLASCGAGWPGAVKHGRRVRARRPTPIIGRPERPFNPITARNYGRADYHSARPDRGGCVNAVATPPTQARPR